MLREIMSNSNQTWDSLNNRITSCYKNTALIWIPCIFLWIFSPLEAYNIKNSQFRDIPRTYINTLKIIFIAVANITSFIDIIDCIVSDGKKPFLYAFNTILRFITFNLCLALTWGNLRKGLRSSSILFLFSFSLVTCGLPEFLEILIGIVKNNEIEAKSILRVYVLYYFSISIIFVTNCFTDPKPRYSSNAEVNRNICPRHTSTLLSKIFLSWFTPFVWNNYKEAVENNLWELDIEDTAKHVSSTLEKYFNKTSCKMKIQNNEQKATIEKRNYFISDDEKFSVIKLLIKQYKFPFLADAFWRGLDAWMILNYPFIFSILISYVKKKDTWKMYLCAFLFAVNASLDAIVLARHYLGLTRLQTRVRSALMTIMYKKMLRSNDRARREYTSGELITLLTVDVNRIVDSVMYLQNLWVTPFQFTLSFYFIWNIFGTCTIFSIIAMIFLFPINKYLLNAMMMHTNIEIDHRDKRGKFIQDLLSGIKILKVFAWEGSFEERTSQLRSEEEKTLKKNGLRHAWLLFLSNCVPILMSCACFAAYYYFSGNLIDAEKAFVVISFFNTFKSPLRVVSNYIPSIIQAFISVERVDNFMNLPEFNDAIISHDCTDAALIMEKATFSWMDSKEAVSLQDLSLEIKKGSLVFIVGSVGSGKSSLISAFLGEMQKTSGYVNVNGEIAYIPQQSWILQTTFKNNITLGDPVSDSLYKKSLKACTLDVDLENFPAGDSTEVGEKGINLSGGQKQRIAIARAICRNADIYFFDDSINAVDFYVSKHIFEHVLGPNGILNDKTRILVTHSGTFLPQSDYIIVMQNGHIVEKGTYYDLLKQGCYFSAFLASYNKDDGNAIRLIILPVRHMCGSDCDIKSDEVNVEHPVQQYTTKDINIILADNSTIGCEEDVFKDTEIESELISKEKSSLRIEEISANAKLIKKEHVETSNIKKEVYLFLFSMIGLTVILWVLILNILTQVFSVLSRLWLIVWSKTNDETENSHSQTFYLLIYVALGLAEAISVLLANRILLNGVYRASSAIYRTFVSSVLKWPLWLIDSTPVGRIINRATADINILDSITCTRLISCLELGNKFLIIILITCYITPISLVIFAIVFILVYFLQKLHGSMAHQLGRVHSNNMAPLSSYFVETISGLASIRANKLEEKFISVLYEKIDLYSSAPYAMVVNYRWCSIRLETLYGLAVSLLIAFTLKQRDNMNIGMLCFAISYAIQWTKEFQWFLSYTMDLENGIISVERIKNFIDSPQESTSDQNSIIPPTEWPNKGHIYFQDYSLQYRQTNNLILKGLTFSVKSGEKIGIIGRTGAGKSSLILGLLRLMEPTSGTIFVDNLDITKIDLKIIRSRFTIIPQDPVLFIGTIRFNLDPRGKYTDEIIWNSLEKSHLKNFIRQLPNGLDYSIEEAGTNISYGQKQLLCLARALLRKSKILILDEATASIDIETDDKIHKTICREFSDCTVLTVTHRLNTIQDYDRVLVLDSGNIIEYDTVENLLRMKNSIFYKLMLKSRLIKDQS